LLRFGCRTCRKHRARAQYSLGGPLQPGGRALIMEKMPYRAELDPAMSQPIAPPAPMVSASVTTSDWQQRLPVLASPQVVLRELPLSDAASLFAMLTSEEVARFISPPPSTVEGFERFIAWTHRQRLAGTYVCFAVTLGASDQAIGIFQVRSLEDNF